MKNTELTIQTATAESLHAFYGERPKRSLRALVVSHAGRPVMVCGVYVYKTMSVIFSDFDEGTRPLLRRNLRVIARCIQWVMATARRRSLPIFAVIKPDTEGADRLLEHMGFEHLHGDIYQCQT